jgi:hypothetical protein
MKASRDPGSQSPATHPPIRAHEPPASATRPIALRAPTSFLSATAEQPLATPSPSAGHDEAFSPHDHPACTHEYGIRAHAQSLPAHAQSSGPTHSQPLPRTVSRPATISQPSSTTSQHHATRRLSLRMIAYSPFTNVSSSITDGRSCPRPTFDAHAPRYCRCRLSGPASRRMNSRSLTRLTVSVKPFTAP